MPRAGEFTPEAKELMFQRSSNCQYLWIGVFQATSVSVC